MWGEVKAFVDIFKHLIALLERIGTTILSLKLLHGVSGEST